MVGFQQFVDRTHRDNLFVRQHRHPVANFIQSIEVVRDEEHGQTQRFLQFASQLIELRRADRIEARRRFVEKQQFGIERQRARKTGAFLHSAGQFGWIFAGRFRRQARQHHLVKRDLLTQFGFEFGIELLERHFHVFAHGQIGEQRPALEQHAPTVAHADLFVGFGFGNGPPEHGYVAFAGDLQPDDGPHQDGFARARPADDAEYFPAIDRQRQMFVNREIAELVDQIGDDDRGAAAVSAIPAHLIRVGPAPGTVTMAGVLWEPVSSAITATPHW